MRDLQDISSSRIYEEYEDDAMIDHEERQALASMRRVEERLDALDAEAEYKGASVHHLREQLEQSLKRAPKLFRADSWREEAFNEQQQERQGQPLDAEEDVVKKDRSENVFNHLGMLTPSGALSAKEMLHSCGRDEGSIQAARD